MTFDQYEEWMRKAQKDINKALRETGSKEIDPKLLATPYVSACSRTHNEGYLYRDGVRDKPLGQVTNDLAERIS